MIGAKVRVHEDGNSRNLGCGVLEQLNAFAGKLRGGHLHKAGDVAPRSRQARDEPLADRVGCFTITMGIFVVACFAAGWICAPDVTRRSMLSRTSSAISATARSLRPSANRRSMTMFLPSTNPFSRNPSTKA